MLRTLQVSIISDQTIQNVLLIKELSATNHLFISTETMEKKGCSQWIINCCELNESNVKIIQVNHDSLTNISSSFANEDFSQYNNIWVNITGGTKLISTSVYEFFKTRGATIFYVFGGSANNYLKLSKEGEESRNKFSYSISVMEYLTAYGFSLERGNRSGIPGKYTDEFFSTFINLAPNQRKILSELINYRDKKNFEIDNIEGLEELLHYIKFPCSTNSTLKRNEIKYLTGEWLEEYIANCIGHQFSLNEEEVLVGSRIKKNGVPNEMDVMFVKNNQLYSIECKTSIYGPHPNNPEKRKSLMGEILYKSDSLSKNFGLFPQTYIAMLCEMTDKNHKDRAKLSRIKIWDKETIIQFRQEGVNLDYSSCL